MTSARNQSWRRTERRGGPPRELGESLQAFLKQKGLLQQMEDRKIVLGWEQLVGPALAREAKPFKIERGILWIGVKNAPQANHLSYLKPKILARIRELFPGSRIRDLRVMHRPM